MVTLAVLTVVETSSGGRVEKSCGDVEVYTAGELISRVQTGVTVDDGELCFTVD